MVAKLFILGATGFLGGTVLQKVVSRHPDVQATALVRSQDKGEALKKKFPSVDFVIGDYESDDVISEASQKADVVLSCASSDELPPMKSVFKGMAKHDGDAFLIHTSGTGILTDPNTTRPGEYKQTELSDKLWDDIQDIKGLHSLPDENLHRPLDRLVLEKNPPNVKTAIIAPPLIYGRGTGLKAFSDQIPDLIHAIFERGEAFQCGKGESTWSNVHVLDLTELHLLLVKDALSGGKKMDWGYDGYYFAENGTHKWGDVSSIIGKVAKDLGFIKDATVKSYDKKMIDEAKKGGNYQWGMNSRSKASRARKYGWAPTQVKLEDTIEDEVKYNRTDKPL